MHTYVSNWCFDCYWHERTSAAFWCSVIMSVTFKRDQRHSCSSWPVALPQNITVVVLPLTQYFVYYDSQIKAELHGQVVRHVEEGRKNACMVRWRKEEGKRQLGIPKRRWDKNIKMDLKEWDRRAWQSIVQTFIKLWLPQNVRNSYTGWKGCCVYILYRAPSCDEITEGE